jgi:hypothetical protein
MEFEILADVIFGIIMKRGVRKKEPNVLEKKERGTVKGTFQFF